jgi:hypothetical protein
MGFGAFAAEMPASMYFFALSQAAPPEVIESPTKRPETIVPIRKPPSAAEPRVKPTENA